MAEVLGTLSTVLSLVETALKALEYIQDFRHAPQEQQKLLSEMDNLRPLLAELQTRITTNPSSSIVGQMQNPLNIFTSTMESFTEKLRPGDGAFSKVSKQLSWSMWSKSEAKEYLVKFEQFKSLLQSWLILDLWDMGQDQRKEHDAILKALDEQQVANERILTTITEARRDHREEIDSARRTQIMEWMTPLNFFQRQSDIFGTWQVGTGEWFLEDPFLKDWESGSGEILWCQGMPGAGKTVLSSVVVNHLARNRNSDTGVACIYLNYKETETQTPVNLLAALWKQLVVGKSIPPPVLQLYTHHRDHATRPLLDEVLEALQSVLTQYSKVYIIVDALDEYPEDRRNILLKYLSPAMLGMTTVNLMLTSRPHVTLEPFFPNFQVLEIRATEEDIGRYVDQQILQSSRLSKHLRTRPELQDEIRAKIIENVEGMFLLAKLHMESLVTKSTIKAVRMALQELPTDLRHTYVDAMERISSQNADDKQLAHLILTWVAYTKRLLSVAELCEALAIEPAAEDLDVDNLLDIDIILSVCSGLVIVDETQSAVRLVHYTTQMYFDSIQQKDFPSAHTDIGSACLTYLSFTQFHMLPDPAQHSLYAHAVLSKQLLAQHPFLAYGQYCLIHAVGAAEVPLRDAIMSYLDRASTWKQVWDSAGYVHTTNEPPSRLIPPWNYPDWPQPASPLWVSAAFNLVDVARHLLAHGGVAGRGECVDQGNVIAETAVYDGSALQAASAPAHEAVVRLLIEKGADVNLRAGAFGSALQVAAYWDHQSLLHLLIENGADVNFQDGGPFGNALQAAAYDGHTGLVRLLLSLGAAVDLDGGQYGSALYAAAVQGHEEILRLLIANGADVNAQGGQFGMEYGSALRVALHQEGIAKIIIQSGADVNEIFQQSSALQAAASWGLDNVAQLLIEHGADVNFQGGQYCQFGSPLQEASFTGHANIARLLIEHGAEVNAEGPQHGSALQAAVCQGHGVIVRLLMENGASTTF
ncbi:ANK-REP-REGION domain-containing protein [Mycena venus]|uniref:ANK-REP-REGION domain-containing protein n=1 Tax=Mycena venus TaxID=2733690 RepID=A0A8H6Y193_9AGAR|nr:ANK-REP-REGION domain-containing protein [Mycena venus]